jgi:hypothetical protein
MKMGSVSALIRAPWPRSLLLAASLLAGAPALSCNLGAQAAPSREYQIKAAFLFNFGQFVTWGPGAFADADAPFVIGVLGDDPFGPTLDALVAGETVQGRRAEIARYRGVEEVGACQILFISSSEAARLDRVFAALAGRSILLVGEAEGFADRSGMIRFRVVDNRLRLEINTTAAAGEGLTISSRLLSLADVVRTEE